MGIEIIEVSKITSNTVLDRVKNLDPTMQTPTQINSNAVVYTKIQIKPSGITFKITPFWTPKFDTKGSKKPIRFRPLT